MNGATSSLSRRFIAGGLILASALLFGCGGGASDSTPPIVEPPPPSQAEAIVPGAQLARSLGNNALVGQPYRSSVTVVPNDRRNSVVALAVTNPTAGGSSPTIDVSGAVTWTPNETDFASTLELTITATLREGPAVTLVSPVRVRKERPVHEEQLPAAAGTIADPNGRYLIKVEPEIAGTPMTGMLSIREVFSANGSFVFVVRVPVTSGAQVTVLDAPETLKAARSADAATDSRRAAAGATGRERPTGVAKDLAADVGKTIDPDLDGFGLVANRGEIEVYTTRGAHFDYRYLVVWQTFDVWKEGTSLEPTRVFQIDANCTSAATCAAIEDATKVKRVPVILIHGFYPFQSIGGGSGTWGLLASELKARGHPVFELRWNTYMRFEEAAGVLSRLSTRVAQITGHQVTVVAHSFGGVVAHLSMMGQGIRYEGDAWNNIPVDGVFQRLITLGAPLSGIGKVPAGPYGLTAGRDDDDLSIAACQAITCFQAGSSDQWGTNEINELTEKLKAIDDKRIGLLTREEGGSIRTLHAAWQPGPAHRVLFSTVVSLKKRPVDYGDRLTNATAFDLGDGLISIMGQAVLPTHFSAHPFEPPEQHDILGTLGADFLTRLDASFAAPMVRVESKGYEYYFALRAAHSCAQRTGGTDCVLSTKSDAYLIANYPEGGRVDISGLGEAAHPLRFFIESTAKLAEPRSPYAGATEAPVALVRGSLVRDGLPLVGERIRFQVEEAATGIVISQTSLRDSDSGGAFMFDAGPALAALAARFPRRLLNVADFNVLVSAGNGLDTARYFLRQVLSNEVALGVIDLTPTPADALVGVAGRVIDGQTESLAIAGADIYLMKGRSHPESLLRRVRDTTTTRRLTADALGQFSASGLEPGSYSALVTKAGYLDQTQGSVFIAADGSSSLTFSLLRVLAADQAAITLRWGAASDGALVSSDLDSHLKKFDSAGTLLYEIDYRNRRGSAEDSLDRDDINYQGPETITLAMDSTARYVYFVHNYAAGGGSLLGSSRATVSIRVGLTLREFSLPPGEAGAQRYWKVFEIVGGAIVPCASGCLVDAAP